MDPVQTCWLMDKHWPEVTARFSAAFDLERSYARLCASMMSAGLMIDRPYIEDTIGQFTAAREATIEWLGQFGITSPEAAGQVGRALLVARRAGPVAHQDRHGADRRQGHDALRRHLR